MDMAVTSYTPLTAFYYTCPYCTRDLQFQFIEQERTCPVCNHKVSLPFSVKTALYQRSEPASTTEATPE